MYSCAHWLNIIASKLVRHPIHGDIIKFDFSGRIVKVFTRRPEDVAEKRAVVPALKCDCAETLFNSVDELLEVHTLERTPGYPILLELEEVWDMSCVRL